MPAGGHTTADGVVGLSALNHAHYVWVSAQCVDGALELGKTGFERELFTELDRNGLRFTYDTHIVQPDCISTEVWELTPETSDQWKFSPTAQVALPAGQACGAIDDHTAQGVVRASGDTLEELRFGSSWCRGFDVRFVYQRAAGAQLDHGQLIRRYVAHWNRRDARALAALFTDNGVLIEPFTRSQDGTPTRHIGRAAIEQWFAAAFATTPWLGLELRDVQALDAEGQWLAQWRYMDPHLAEPLSGRNLFVIADGEIFTTELQLLDEPHPQARAAAPSGT